MNQPTNIIIIINSNKTHEAQIFSSFSILEEWLKMERRQFGRYKGNLNNLVNMMESLSRRPHWCHKHETTPHTD